MAISVMEGEALAFGQDPDQSRRFLRFVVAISVLAAISSEVVFVLSPRYRAVIPQAALVVVLVATGMQSFRNEGLVVGPLATLVFWTVVFVTSRVASPVTDSSAVAVYLTIATGAVAVGLVVAGSGVLAGRLAAMRG